MCVSHAMICHGQQVTNNNQVELKNTCSAQFGGSEGFLVPVVSCLLQGRKKKRKVRSSGGEEAAAPECFGSSLFCTGKTW